MEFLAKLKNLSALNLILVCCLSLAGCGGGSETTPNSDRPPIVDTPPTINEKPTLEVSSDPFWINNAIEAGQEIALSVKGLDTDGQISTITLTLNGERISSINSGNGGSNEDTYQWLINSLGQEKLDPGSYTIDITVRDDQGAEGTAQYGFSIVPHEETGEIEPENFDHFVSAPAAYLDNINLNRLVVPPIPVKTGSSFTGNGHAVSWDGRFYIVTRQGGWNIQVFRPEKIKLSNGVPNFKSGAFDAPACFEHNDDSTECLDNKNGQFSHNWLSIVRDTSFAQNPYQSDQYGQPLTHGEFSTYKAKIFHSDKDDNEIDWLGMRSITVTLANPYTENANLASFSIDDEFTYLKSTTGQHLPCIEPSLTIDGHLLFCNGNREGGTEINDIVYSWNSTAGSATGWQDIKSAASLYSERNELIDGMALQERFPIARQPIRDMDGTPYSGLEEINGAYPWISRDGSELFWQAVKAVNNGNRVGTSVVGRWTGGVIRHIDGAINPTRGAPKDDPLGRKPRLFISSPGAFSTMWAPFGDVANLKIPYSEFGPAYPIFGSNTSDYNEVGFNDYTDGNYIVALGMNELLTTGFAYDVNRTPDTSGNLNNASMIGALFPQEYLQQDAIKGIKGQAIYFPSATKLVVEQLNQFERLQHALTIEFFIKPLIADVYQYSPQIIALGESLTLSFNQNGELVLTIVDATGTSDTLVANTSASINNWSHLGVSLDADTHAVNFYQNGQLVDSQQTVLTNWRLNEASLVIGPTNVNTGNDDAVFMLDEFKLSNVVRKPQELAYSAMAVNVINNQEQAFINQVPSYLLPHRHLLKNHGVVWSSDKAELGEALFSDVILSKQRTTSCASCHDAQLQFSDGEQVALSDESSIDGTRNTPSIFNRAMSGLQSWDGSNVSLIEQSISPIETEIEMNLPIAEAINRLNQDAHYRALFQAVYGEAVTQVNLADALVAFQLVTFAPSNANDDENLTLSQQRGKQLFNGKARCVGCHSGVNFTDESFRRNGLVTHEDDLGRMGVTARFRDKFLFKVPSLRQVNATSPYMHDGSISTLAEVVDAYIDESVSDHHNLDNNMLPIELNDAEKQALISFLSVL
ncbi:MAG: hypothetical protein HRT38_08210 [Alteromonadaceae bacterium]|nr:hypothetical protein [Alteromonadaceae bacterium]